MSGGSGGKTQAGGSGGLGQAGESLGGSSGLSGFGGSSNVAGSSASAGSGQGGSASALSAHALAATPHGACALDDAGKIACWGLAPEVWDIPSGTFVELYSGRANYGTVCAVRSDRTTACFPEPFGTPGMDDYPAVPVKSLAVGLGVICGVDTSDNVFCNAATSALELVPPDGEAFTTLSVGNQFGCGIRTSDRTITCWSADDFGMCDYSPPDNQLDAPAGAFKDISSSAFTTCAVADDGSVKCWGLGEADDDPNSGTCFAAYNLGQANPPSGSFRAVAVGNHHTCAVGKDGTLACWGAGTTVDCADDDINCGQSLPPSGTFEQVSVGLYHSCAMRADRTVACWGYDGDGDGRTTPPDAFQ